MWVVKLGGSLMYSDYLRSWLTMLVELGDGRIVIVPGGGEFADGVRKAQKTWQIDDGTAHDMAIMAMEQFAMLCHGIAPCLRLMSAPHDILASRYDPRPGIWLPYQLLREHPEIPKNWRVTSDSLAAWLCHQIKATDLFLVKSTTLGIARQDVSQMVKLGIVDEAFSDFTLDLGCNIRCIEARQMEIFRQMISVRGSVTDCIN